MNLDGMAFAIGPIGAMAVWPVSLLALVAASRRSRWVVKPGVWLLFGVATVWLGYWALQQLEFGYVVAQESVPPLVATGVTGASALCAIGVLGLFGTVTAAVLAPRRTRG